MLLDRIRQRRDAIRQIGAEAADRAGELGIQPVNVVYPEPKTPLAKDTFKMLKSEPCVN